MINKPKYAKVIKCLQRDLKNQMEDLGLTEETDKMPIDEGIKQALPDEKIR